MCLAALLAPCTALSGRLAVRQKRPKLLAAAKSLAFAIADTLNKPGQFPAALHAAPVYPNDVAVQGLAFPGSRRVRAQSTPSPVTDRIQIQQTCGSWRITRSNCRCAASWLRHDATPPCPSRPLWRFPVPFDVVPEHPVGYADKVEFPFTLDAVKWPRAAQ